MAIFKSSDEIFSYFLNEVTISTSPPITEDWHNQRAITMQDVSIWEQIYHQPGNVGIYVAHCPYAEYYIIVYELFLDTPYGIVTYSGPDAIESVCNKAMELGIALPTNERWVDNN